VLIFFKNALSESSQLSVDEIYRMQILPFLEDNIKNYTDLDIIIESLYCLKYMLEYGEKMKGLSFGENAIKKEIEKIGLVERIESFQINKEEEIENTASNLMQKYWGKV
jgi:hypothetical protein